MCEELKAKGYVARWDGVFGTLNAFDGVFIHPASGSHPAVILWPDIAGLRPAKVQMGRRLAEAGYAVLVANPYYRSVSGQQFADFDDWRNNDGWNKVTPWREANTPEAVQETARAVVAWLDEQDAVDSARGIGNQGYCMTGSWTILAATAVPGRIKAAGNTPEGVRRVITERLDQQTPDPQVEVRRLGHRGARSRIISALKVPETKSFSFIIIHDPSS